MTANKTAAERTRMLFDDGLGPQIVERSTALEHKLFPRRYVLISEYELGRGHLLALEDWKAWNKAEDERTPDSKIVALCGDVMFAAEQHPMGKGICQLCASKAGDGKIVRVRKGVR